jgi:purine-nucleoside phosphorylase
MDLYGEQERKRLENCLRQLRLRTDFIPDVALVLGSGLGAFAESVEAVCRVDYAEIDGFPVSTVPGHAGRFVFGSVRGTKVAVLQGRIHYYEVTASGMWSCPRASWPSWAPGRFFSQNAAGGIRKSLTAGDLMLIRDHISLFFPNPLVGPNLDPLGPRFPDMSRVYDEEMAEVVRLCAEELEIPLHEGVYAQLTGPSYETPAEIRMLERLGADAVGMSTACEAIAARHAGLRVCGISCISNKAAGLSEKPLSHAEVQEAADRAAPQFQALLQESLARIGALLQGQQ